MLADRPQKDQIFNAAAELRNHAERAAYLEAACGKDPKLRAEIEELLQHDMEAGSFLESPAPGLVATALASPVTETVGTMVGRYKLREQIGEGGMGVVYVAEQLEPVRRKVALKVIKPGMDTREVIARFEAERQALALMDHPNIAHVLDAGATDSGRPYFVMELVRGVPITEFCDQARLNARQRLELFVQVCQAVQHAHHKGIIHRDLKPSNVLVTMHDDKAVPKVIDFGVAKATQQRLTEQTLYTQFSQMVGTPLYMSPEQAQMSGLDVDTRSDIYSLGVLLYELLTGSTPFNRDTLRTAGYDEMRRIIREEEPPRPSARVSTLEAQDLSTVSDKRSVDPRKLSHQLQGELDWIVMKALEKDRTRRYETANAFAADVEAYLDDLPVAACPPSALYRLSKLARRHRAAWITTALVAASLIVGTVVSVWQAFEAYEARAVAHQSGVTARAEWRRAESNLELALRGFDEIYGEFLQADAPEEQLTEDEVKLVEKGLVFFEAFARQNEGARSARFETAKAYQRVGRLRTNLRHIGEAEEVYRQSIRILEDLCRESPKSEEYAINLARSQVGMARAYARNGQSTEAIRLFVDAESSLEEMIGVSARPVDHMSMLEIAQWRLADELKKTGELQLAEAAYRRAVETQLRAVTMAPERNKNWLRLSWACFYLEGYLATLGRVREAEPIYRRVLERMQQLMERLPRSDKRHLSGLANVMKGQAVTLLFTGRAHQADPLLAESTAIFRRIAQLFPEYGLPADGIANGMEARSWLLQAIGRTDEAIELYRQVIALRRGYGDNQWKWMRLARLHHDLGRLLKVAGKPHEAEAELRNAIRLRKKILSQLPYVDEHLFASVETDLGRTYVVLGRLLLESESRTEAHSAFLSGKKVLQRVLTRAPNHIAANIEFASLLANCPDEDVRDALRAEQLAKELVEANPQIGLFYRVWGMAQYRRGEWQEATRSLLQSEQRHTDKPCFDWFFLGMTHWQLGQKAEAQKRHAQAIEWMDQNAHGDEGLRSLRAEAEELMGIHNAKHR